VTHKRRPTPPAGRRVRPRPISALHAFSFFAGGFFLKLNGRKRGSVGLPVKTGSGGCPIRCLVSIFSLVIVQGTGCHPRHPPRAFPLGLLAPRCLGAVLFLASIACGLSGFGHRSIWGEEVFLPPASGSSSQWSFRSLQCRADYAVRREFVFRLNVPSESALAQPPSTFPIVLSWCRFRYWVSVLQ